MSVFVWLSSKHGYMCNAQLHTVRVTFLGTKGTQSAFVRPCWLWQDFSCARWLAGWVAVLFCLPRF